MALDAFILAAAIVFGELDGTSRSRFAWAFLPVPGVDAMAAAVWRHARRLDEYQRGLLVGSLALTFATAMAIAVTMGLLAGAGLESRRLFGCRIEEVVDPWVTVGGLSGH